MRRLSVAVTLAALISTASAEVPVLKTPSPVLKPLDEVWEAAFVQDDRGVDVKIGYIHMTSVPVDVDGKKLLRTTKELRFVVGRADAKAEMKADVSSDEDSDGKVNAITAKIWLGKDKVQKIDCEVLEGNKVRVTAGVGAVEPRVFNWDPANVGLAREQALPRA